MIDIVQHIEFLLLHHDCVVVPGLGAFIVNTRPARYVEEAHEFMPPSRTIGFNPEVRHNDALLAGSISRRNGLPMSVACAELDSSVESMLHQLELTGEFPLGKLGMLVRGELAGYPAFEPAADSLPFAVYGRLSAVKCEPLFAQDVDASEEIAATGSRIISIPTPLKIVASVIVIMVALGIVYSTRGLVNGSKVYSASLDTGLSAGIGQSVHAFETSIDDEVSREIVLNIALPSEPEQAGELPLCQGVLPSSKRYLLVVGSFPNQTMANRHIASVGDPSLRVIEMDGNYRIFAGTAATIDSARKFALSLSAVYPNVWICRR